MSKPQSAAHQIAAPIALPRVGDLPQSDSGGYGRVRLCGSVEAFRRRAAQPQALRTDAPAGAPPGAGAS